MNLDVLIFIAFCFFIILIIWRVKEKQLKTETESESSETRPQGKLDRVRRWWLILQLLVLAALLVPMAKYLSDDFRYIDNRSMLEVGVRCLLFLLTFIVLITRIIKLVNQKNNNKLK